MLCEIKGVCHLCRSDYKIIISESETHGSCPNCDGRPIKFKKFKGMVYIINNPNQVGVKIGLTTKDIKIRLKKLSSTGVPGKFSLVALFPSDRPEEDERKAHEKLKKFFLDKEHFDISPIDAVLCVYRALNRRKPIFNDKIIEKEFLQKIDEARKDMQRKLGSSIS